MKVSITFGCELFILFLSFSFSGLCTITEEPLVGKEWSKRRLERARRPLRRAAMAPSINLIGLPHLRAEIPCGGSNYDGKYC